MDWLTPIFGIAEGIYSAFSQNRNYNYQKSIQQQIFQREDNAVQRRSADLKKAGLSKVLAAGDAAGAGSVVSTSAPESDIVGRYAKAMEINKAKAEIDNINADSAVKAEQANNVRQDTQYKMAQESYVEAQTLLTQGNYAMLGLKKEEAQAMIDKARAETESILLKQGLTIAEIDKARAEIDYTRANTGFIYTKNKNQMVYYDILQAQLAGLITENKIKHMDYLYQYNTGLKPGTGGQFGTWAGIVANALANGFGSNVP